MQLEHGASLTRMLKLIAVVAAHVLLLLASKLRLHAYAPMYMALSDPPNEFAPYETLELAVEAMQLMHGASLTTTFRPVAIVASHLLMLLAKLAADSL
jgi:hypothetical protein